MSERETTVRSRELGAGLRRVLGEAGLSGKDVARKLDWSQPDVSRLLTGKRAIRETDVAALLGACGAKAEERERLLRLCREAARPGWWQQHGSRLPKQLRTLIDHEDNALAVGDYQAIMIPGLLQTADYARAVMVGNGGVPTEEIDDRVAARLARQNIFGRVRGAHYTFFVHEFVLRLPVGGEGVMSEQLHHLLRMSVRSYLDVRVVPATIGAHAGTAGSFRLMEFAEIKPVVYLESETSTLFLEESGKSPRTGAFSPIWRTARWMRDNRSSSSAILRSSCTRAERTMMTTPDPHGFTWRKSSHSAANGDCVEVGWRKSSHSAANGGCVEVGRWDLAEIRVRDTKNRTGGTLAFPAAHWRRFLITLR